MKKYISILFLVVCLTERVQSQNFYFKANTRFHLPITYQVAPKYFTSERTLTPGPGVQSPIVQAINNKFSIAMGLSYGGEFGYYLNSFFGTEIGFYYFRMKKTMKSDYDSRISSDWDFNTVNAVPLFLIYRNFNKSAFVAKFGPIMGFSSLEKTIICESTTKTYKFNTSLSIGYLLGFEYNYNLNKYLALTIEFGIENLFYTPKKAILTEFKWDEYSLLESQPTCVKEIEYVKEVNNQQVYYNQDAYSYVSSTNEPLNRFTETLKLNSVFLGISLKYKIGSDEKN